MIWYSTYGERLNKIRTDHGLSMKAMAQSVGVTGPTWSNYEKDVTFPAPSTVCNLCSIYHVNEDWLSCGEGKQYADGYMLGDPLGEAVDYQEKLRRDMEEFRKQWTIDSTRP